MVRHFVHAHLHLVMLLYALAVACAAVIWFAHGRRRRRRIEAVLDLFDPGTTETNHDLGAYLVRGLFHGRPASVSARRGLLSEIHVCMTGRFYLGFEARTARGRRSAGTAKALRATWRSVVLCIYILLFFFGELAAPATFFWKSFVVLFAIYWIGYPLIYFYGKVMGYFEESPVAVCEVQLPGLGTLPFGTWHPARLRAAVDRPEIRDSLTRLLDSCHADSLEAPTDARFGGGYRNWPFSVGTAWFGRDKLLNKEVVGKTLTELSTLCADLEQAFPEAMRI